MHGLLNRSAEDLRDYCHVVEGTAFLISVLLPLASLWFQQNQEARGIVGRSGAWAHLTWALVWFCSLMEHPVLVLSCPIV